VPRRACAASRPASTSPQAQEIIDLGVARLKDYQGDSYAERYLERVRSLGEADAKLVAETARHLAVWMSYEDIIRVADLKTRASRFERVRREVSAQDGEPVVVIDYLKPGIEELASAMPAWLGRRLIAWAERNAKLDAYNVGMHIKTSSVLGFLLVRALAWLKPWRPYSYRFQEEQALIERWLAQVRESASRDARLALEIVECASLLKGYGETHRRGKANFLAVLDTLAENPASGDPREQAEAIRKAREAALADPEGKALGTALGKPVVWLKPAPAAQSKPSRTSTAS
jgi:indolepyruvate ferredoxin oxidoreductase, beta subunit